MPPPDTRVPIRSTRTASHNMLSDSLRRETQNYNNDVRPAPVSRSTTFEGPTQLRDMSPIGASRMSRVPSENINMRAQRSQLRPMQRVTSGSEVINDPYDDPALNNDVFEKPWEVGSQRSASPALSQGSTPPSRSASYSTLSSSLPSGKKHAPPPPPSRAKKPPPPPPPPMKRSALSTNNVSYA